LNKSSRRRGQALSEHGLLIALIVVLVISSIGFFGASATGLFDSINSAINGGQPSANPSSSPTSNPTGGSPGGSLIISDPAPAAGQIITLTGSGFKSNTPVQAVLHPNTIVLKTQNADNNGHVSMEVQIPSTIDLGHHTISLEGQNPANTPITVTSQPLTIGANPVSVTAQKDSGPLYSGNYTTAAYTFSAIASGGLGALTYTWTGPDGFTAAGLTPAYSFACAALPGNVTFSATDGLRHQAEVTIALAACPSPMTTNASITAGPTYGDNYSNVTYTFASSASGGQSPLTTGWSGPGAWTSAESAPTQTFTCAALPGSVTYTSTDANGQVGHVTLSLPACTTAITLNLSTGTQTYSGNYTQTTVVLNANVAGGVTPYTYAWTGPGGFTSSESAPAITVACSALPADASLTISDANGKSNTAVVALPVCTNPISLNASLTSGPLYAGNYSSVAYTFNGSAAGGTGALDYAWTGPDGFTDSTSSSTYTFSCSALNSNGTVSLTVTDSGQKSNSTTIILPPCADPLGVTGTSSTSSYSTNYTNENLTIGSVSVTGGNGHYSYSWSAPGAVTSNLETPYLTISCGALPGTLALTVSDTNGQSFLYNLDLGGCPAQMNLAANLTSASYNGNYLSKSFTLGASLSGGQTPYTYAWSGLVSGSSATLTPTINCTGLSSPVNETLIVIDAHGQTATSSVTVPACPSSIGVTATKTSGPLYDGNYSTATDVFGGSASGGVGTLTYAWTGPSSFTSGLQNPSFMFACTDLLAGGTVTLTVSDGVKNNTSTVSLAACANPIAPNLVTPTSTVNGANVTYTLNTTASGGNSPYTYGWTTNVTGGNWSPTTTVNSANPTLTVPCANINGGSTVSVYVIDNLTQTSNTQSQTLAVCPVLTVTVSASTKVYGATLPTFGVTYSGFTGGDTATNLGGTLTYSTSATNASVVGSYTVSASGQTSTKYRIVYATGTLTVTQAPLTITALSASMTQGATPPTITATYTGLVNGDVHPATQPTCSTTATSASAPGSYPSTCTGAADANYSISNVNGSIVVNSPPPGYLQSRAYDGVQNRGSIAPSFTSPTKSGDTLIVALALDARYGTLTTPNTPANWTLISNTGDPTAQGFEVLIYAYQNAPVFAGGASLGTWTISANNSFSAMVIAEYKNLNSAVAPTVGTAAYSNGTTYYKNGSSQGPANNTQYSSSLADPWSGVSTLYIAVFSADATHSTYEQYTSSSSFTIESQTPNSGNGFSCFQTLELADYVVTSGSPAATVTEGYKFPYVAQIIALKGY
jgi:Flp pilus assembly pilin Flp